MAIRFGSASGRRERVNYRPNEGELDCGSQIYVYLRQIQKTETYEDEYFSCSIGIICEGAGGGEYPDWCPQTVTLRIREEANPKFEPRDGFKGAQLEYVVEQSENGEAALDLACELKPRMVSFELTADLRGDVFPDADDLLGCTTADGAMPLVGTDGVIPISIPSEAKWVRTDKSVDRPPDDFWTTTVTYTWRKPYPDEATRRSYIRPVLEALNMGSIVDEVLSRATFEVEGSLRQGDTPIRRVTINWQAVPNFDS